jgi:regulator of nucleoside diphosphate kinase
MKTAREIRITARDMAQLRKFIEDLTWDDPRKRSELKDLEAELDRAVLVDDAHVPADVITMHSEARLVDEETGEEMVCKLVFPDEADIAEMRISVLAPIGTAMLGYRVGDRFEWEVPAGRRTLLVKEILYQPENSKSS